MASLFNTIISGLDEEIERTFGNFSETNTLGRIADLLVARKALQGNLARFDPWAESNYLTFNKAKCWVLT